MPWGINYCSSGFTWLEITIPKIISLVVLEMWEPNQAESSVSQPKVSSRTAGIQLPQIVEFEHNLTKQNMNYFLHTDCLYILSSSYHEVIFF